MTDRTAPRRIDRLFVLCVIVPTLIAVVYFGLLAADVYVSESRFIVHAQDKAAPTALGLLLTTATLGHATAEGGAAQSYLLSRDALAALDAGGAYAGMMTRPSISRLDRFDPWGQGGAFEDLYRYYLAHVRVDTDTALGVTVLTVRAYRPDDARAINERLLGMAEATVNGMSERARRDLVAHAQAEAIAAKSAARAANAALARYRNATGVVDPEKQAPIQYELIARLQDELIEARSDRRQLGAVAPQSLQIPALDARIREIEGRIAERSGQAAGDRRSSLASAGEGYEQLSLDADVAAKRLAAALAALQAADTEAQHQSSYVERVVQPNRPDIAIEPHRLRGMATTLVFSLIVWGVARMLIAGIREHGA